MKKTAIVMIKIYSKNVQEDLEIPLDITVNDLMIALNSAYGLDIDVSNIRSCYLKTENPIALLHGNKLLADYGIRNGTVLYLA
ncbi:MAG: EsaB/YukD family protein [Oliverpabstia sp.]